MLTVNRTNIILYCKRWPEMVDFYGQHLQLPIHYQSKWFVEFQLCEGSFISVADETRTTIKSANGAGITLTWRVGNIYQAHAFVSQQGIKISDLREKWGAVVCYLYDPEGNRIELWQSV
ncbi:MAG: VOC family protein [Anaerolineae bacterium]|nr:VOC family protein [Anaerolineae bacterium]